MYNNLACCLIKLDRGSEAYKLLRLAEVIFEAELGLFHERTRTAKQNKDKAVRAGLDVEVAYRPMWQFFYNNEIAKIGVGGVKAEKKKVVGKKK